MYKDFKKSETLDTGFTSGSSLLWMFSGIVLGLLVGLGMYFFSNDKMPRVSMIDSLEKKIQKVQTAKKQLNNASTALQRKSPQSTLNQPQGIQKAEVQQRKNKFSYYAVLPNLDVPVSSAKPINTSMDVTNVASTPSENSIAETQVAVETKTAVIETPTEEAIEIPTIGDYMLQVASFKKESMADKTRGRLNNKGIDAYIQKKKIKGRYWYRVVAGPVDQSSVDSWKYTAEKLGHKPLVISVR